jgi:hypothetical protein
MTGFSECVRGVLDSEPGSVSIRSPEGIEVSRAATIQRYWEMIAKPNPEHYAQRLVLHRRVMVPECLTILRSKEWVADTDFWVRFVFSAPYPATFESGDLDYIKLTELGNLRREAHLRSARYAAPRLDDAKFKYIAIPLVAEALMAGVSAKDMGLSNEVARVTLRYLGKEGRDPTFWQAAKNGAKYLNFVLGGSNRAATSS